MIDLVSTRDNADEQTIACARLLVAVIAAAFEDLCKLGSNDEKKEELFEREVRNQDALESVEFFFGRNPAFNVYAKFLGLDADEMRAALLGLRTTTNNFSPLKPLISEAQWLTVRRRLHLCGIHSIDDIPKTQRHTNN